MNKRMLKSTLLILVAVCSFPDMWAQSVHETGYLPQMTNIELKDVHNRTTRPRVPSRQHIDCWYGDGVLNLNFVIPEGNCTLYITDLKTSFTRMFIFDSTEPTELFVGPLTEAYIEIATSNGHTYEGWHI